jgi:hypothetical protein
MAFVMSFIANPFTAQVSKSMLGTKVFQEGCVDQVVGLLLEHLAICSTHIAFPEYAVPTVVQVCAGMPV